MGAGRLGTALARALAAKGYDVRAVVARRASHARRAAESVSALSAARPLALSASELEKLPPSDILFITTPDDGLAETAARLAATLNISTRRRVALHASGALASQVLAPLREKNFRVGSMHPLVSVSEAGAGAESLRAAFYCVEGDREASRVARRIVRDLGGESFSIETKDKALYHAAAVLTSGHAVALFDVASNLLARCGLSKPRARRLLLPLLRSTLENLSTQKTPARALTGTFARADAATVRKHLDALADAKPDDVLEIYALLGRCSLLLAKECGANAKALREIADALDAALAANARRGE